MIIKKFLFICLLLLPLAIFSQPLDQGRARGMFFSLAIGPRIPVSAFANSQSLGVGINMDISYTDNTYLPLFVYGRIGYEHYPGSADYYRRTDYSSYTVNVVPLNAGVRFYLPPLVKDMVLIIPAVEFGGSFAIFEKSHQFKLDSGRNNFLEDNSKLGFHAGVGLSMFLIEIMGTYNYYLNNEYLSADLRVRIPVFIKL
ncbi:MAG: hypothetical protein ACM3MI_13095 [Clostridiales bacterium]